MCDAAHTFELDDANGKTAESGNVFRAITSTYTAAVFIIVPIDNVMTTVFDAPVVAVGVKNTFWVGLVRCTTGDAISDFTGVFVGFFICGLALDDKSLPDMRKVQIAVEFGCRPDFTDFNPTVIRRVDLDKIRIFPVFKIKRDVFKKSGLVVLDGKVIMGVTVSDQVVGYLALGQEGIGGNIFALNIDGIKQRNGGLDFVGALNLLVGYGQGTYFFWV